MTYEQLSSSTLYWPTVVELVLFCLATAVLLGRSAWQSYWEHRLKASFEACYLKVVAYLTEQHSDLEDSAQAVKKLPQPERLRLIGGLTLHLAGEDQVRLLALADATGLMETASSGCRDHRWWVRLQGVRTLVTLGKADQIPETLVRDPHYLVRAEAAYLWTSRGTEGIASLIELLGEPSMVARFTVQDALLRMGQAVGEPLSKFLAKEEQAGTLPALEVASRLAHPATLIAILNLANSEDAEIRTASAKALGGLGGKDAQDKLLHLLDDVNPEVRVAAAEAVGVLSDWKATAKLATLLSDENWPVRKAAGLALIQTGPPGKLYLTRYAREDKSMAGIMSRYVLALPYEPHPEESF